MKKSIKLLLVIIAITLVANSIAQDFGVKGGLNLSTMKFTEEDFDYDDYLKTIPGFHVGATAEFPITDIFSFEAGLLLSTKGYRFVMEESFLGESFSFDSRVNLFYLDIPLTAKATYDLGGAKIYGLFGPYAWNWFEW